MKYFLWFLIIPALFACHKQQSPPGSDLNKPDSLISRRQMVRILTDVHLTEAAVSFIKTRGDASKDLSEDYYTAVFSKYKISRKNFESNFDYYKRDQEELIKIYEEVIDNLEGMKKQWQPKQDPAPATQSN
jgi:hypothetical protein